MGGRGDGELRQNNGKFYSSPVQIPGTNWSIIKGGSGSFIAKKTDNTLWSWGSSSYGTLAQNNLVSYSSPIQIPGEWSSLDQFNFTLGNGYAGAMGQKLI